jgi:signal transduction histidine kinase
VTAPALADAIPLRRDPTSIRELLQSSLALLRQQSGASGISMTVTVDDRVPHLVSLDAAKIAWVVTTLVGNSLRYVSRGSRVMPGGTIAVRGTYDAARSEVVIEVQDDGPGIPHEKIRDLYSPGAQSPRTALGLLLVRDIAIRTRSTTARPCASGCRYATPGRPANRTAGAPAMLD